VLLLDEPASGLDPDSRRALAGLLLELKAQGMTLIVSSHILSELEDYASEMIIMEAGRIMGGEVKRAAGDESRILIELDGPRPEFESVLRAREGLAIVNADSQKALVSVKGGAAERHALLKALIEAGLPVANFALHKVSLEELYFEEISSARRPS
jgi:ABC-2 type transport system ATP-binding protein